MSEFEQSEVVVEAPKEESAVSGSTPTAAGPKVKPKPTLSQKDYRPTPYVSCEWEVVGERVAERDFISMNLEIVRDARMRADPMFESFDPDTSYLDAERFQTPGSSKRAAMTEEQAALEAAAEQMDPAILQAMLDEKYEEGKQAGYQVGRKEAELQIVESYEALAGRMREVTEKIEREVQGHVTALERKALEFALEVAKKILITTAEIKPDYIFNVIRTGMQSLGAAEPIRVRVSLDDYEFLDVIGLPNDLSEGELGVKYVADENIKSGCIIETNFGEVSLELDTMWEQIKDNLFAVTS
ncbi:MAG: hypothetical protein KDD69_04970 [Bdellovibrionales bacterium]|nr:hypothetical protein [Bdellovibrionales bacterium]